MIYLGNDLTFTFGDPDPLTDSVTGAVVTDAVMTGSLLDAAGAAIAGTEVAMPHVAAGLYRGTLAAADLAAAGMAAGQDVYRRYTATSAGRTGRWDVPDVVAVRAT